MRYIESSGPSDSQQHLLDASTGSRHFVSLFGCNLQEATVTPSLFRPMDQALVDAQNGGEADPMWLQDELEAQIHVRNICGTFFSDPIYSF